VKITVDMEACQSHGRCAFVAPAIFQLDDDLNLTYDPTPAEGLRTDVEDAISACPEQAIRELADRPE
jgi:ferredoxin